MHRCISCGFCLPTCPTYNASLLERSSPRGRLRLIKAVAYGELPVSDIFAEEMSYCLACRACETACPAGVQYGKLAEAARAFVREQRPPRFWPRLLRTLILEKIFPYPNRLNLLGRLLYWSQRLKLPEIGLATGVLKLWPALARITPLAPRVAGKFSHQIVPAHLPARGARRGRVGVLSGCVAGLIYPDVNLDTVEVLARNGWEVVVPPQQRCCGSLHGHTGDHATAMMLARHNIDVFLAAGVQAIIVNAAGCSSFMKEYDFLLADDPEYAEKAKTVAHMTRDICEFLAETGFTPPLTRGDGGDKVRVTYHEACHLAHAQKIRSAPRRVLAAIPGLALVELPESDWCCGSAGIYNVVRHKDAEVFLERKMKNIESTGASIVVSGNPGCSVQLEYGARSRGLALQVRHPVSLLAEAYRSENGAERET
ncbi:4Fe-4S dicluster domain-containing protein [bacterium]|nr:4Fe-4S dicluster domain-containing protein [bacterium]